MSTLATSSDQVVLARQPILNAAKETIAFELLYRSGNSQSANVLDARQATASVLVNALNTVGMAALVGKTKAFVNCDRSTILEDVFAPLDPKCFVLEILEDVGGDEAVAKEATCQTAFLTGMLSCMDALCNVRMESLVKEFELSPEVTAALTAHEGLLGKVLHLAKAMETGDFVTVNLGCEAIYVTTDAVRESMAESWAWIAQNRK